ncbi:MAG TPA: MarR family transcriptional regulator [Mycobacterium sp.]|nr:MarR family transcriptional regulator [Mycobacterium sp.]
MPHDDVALDPRRELSPAAVSDLYVTSHLQLKRVVDDAMQAAGLSLARTKLLEQLRQGAMRQQALAMCFGFAPRSITDMVDGLERDGLAERLDDPNDRRAKLVQLTAAGEEALTAALEVRGRLIEHIFGALSVADRRELVRLVRLLDASVASSPDFLTPTH